MTLPTDADLALGANPFAVNLNDVQSSTSNGGNTPTDTPTAAPTQKGLTVAEVSVINSGVNGGVAVLGQVFDALNNSANRDAQAQVRQMQFDLARGAQDLQRAQMTGNQELQLQLARLQGDRLGAASNLAGASGDPAAAAALAQLRDANAALTRRLEEQSATPMWVWGVAAAVGVVAVGGVAYVLATKNKGKARAGVANEDELEERRREIRARLRELGAR